MGSRAFIHNLQATKLSKHKSQNNYNWTIHVFMFSTTDDSWWQYWLPICACRTRTCSFSTSLVWGAGVCSDPRFRGIVCYQAVHHVWGIHCLSHVSSLQLLQASKSTAVFHIFSFIIILLGCSIFIVMFPMLPVSHIMQFHHHKSSLIRMYQYVK